MQQLCFVSRLTHSTLIVYEGGNAYISGSITTSGQVSLTASNGVINPLGVVSAPSTWSWQLSNVTRVNEGSYYITVSSLTGGAPTVFNFNIRVLLNNPTISLDAGIIIGNSGGADLSGTLNCNGRLCRVYASFGEISQQVISHGSSS